jgi:hypothetical protein
MLTEPIMHVIVYVLSTCVPQEVEPCFPQVFGDEKSALDAMDAAVRAEWVIADPHDDAGEPLAYPGDPVEPCDHLARHAEIPNHPAPRRSRDRCVCLLVATPDLFEPEMSNAAAVRFADIAKWPNR